MNTNVYNNNQTGYDILQLVGKSGTPSPGGTTVTISLTSSSGYVVRAFGATVPADGETNFGKGCVFTKTDGSYGNTIWINEGASTSAAFRAIQTGGVGNHASKAAINATATATAAQILTGYITSTSAAATVITLPTGTLMGAALGATQGTTFDFFVDNTAGANTVTIAVAVNGILSDGAVTAGAVAFGDLTVASGVTGVAKFTMMFSSATAYVFSRTG